MSHNAKLSKARNELTQAARDLEGIRAKWPPGFEQSEKELDPVLANLSKTTLRIRYMAIGLGVTRAKVGSR